MENLIKNVIVTLKKGEGRTIKSGGAWIFDNEIDTIMGSFKNGAVVEVKDFDGYPMGQGFINQNSKIRVRMLTRNPETVIDEAFLLDASTTGGANSALFHNIDKALLRTILL